DGARARLLAADGLAPALVVSLDRHVVAGDGPPVVGQGPAEAAVDDRNEPVLRVAGDLADREDRLSARRWLAVVDRDDPARGRPVPSHEGLEASRPAGDDLNLRAAVQAGM